MNVQAVAAEEKAARAGAHSCRLCGGHVEDTFVDLGMSPLCESFLTAEQLDADGAVFIRCTCCVCDNCFLVQLQGIRQPERHLHRVRLFLVLFDVSWVAARASATAR